MATATDLLLALRARAEQGVEAKGRDTQKRDKDSEKEMKNNMKTSEREYCHCETKLDRY